MLWSDLSSKFVFCCWNYALLPCYPCLRINSLVYSIAIIISHGNCKLFNKPYVFPCTKGRRKKEIAPSEVDRCVQLMLNGLRISILSNASSFALKTKRMQILQTEERKEKKKKHCLTSPVIISWLLSTILSYSVRWIFVQTFFFISVPSSLFFLLSPVHIKMKVVRRSVCDAVQNM